MTYMFLLCLFVLKIYPFLDRTGDVFQLIESDIAKYSQTGKCLVFGDFNGRTSLEPDFCTDDEKLSRFMPDDGTHYIDDDLPRNNQDTSPVDNYGKHLLHLCIGTGLRIINGRVLGDSLGQHTCFASNGKPSTIDYFLSSESILSDINHLKVLHPTIHSIHCFMKLSISVMSYIDLHLPDESQGMKAAINYKCTSGIIT